MENLTLGGILDDWSFGISTVSAAATVAAVVVALVLAHRATEAARQAGLDFRLSAASQVVTVYRHDLMVNGQSPWPGPLVETYNGSGDAITALEVEVQAAVPATYSTLDFLWEGHGRGQSNVRHTQQATVHES